ncbi:MAG: hypothetical protein AAFQ22_04550 [Pseudomonadota bacterium]
MISSRFVWPFVSALASCLVAEAQSPVIVTDKIEEPGDAAPQEAMAADDAPTAMEFPRTLTFAEGGFTIYEPQIEDHAGFTKATAWSAASFRPAGGDPTFGSTKYKASMVVDRQNRLVTVFDREILDIQFPELDEAEAAELEETLRRNIATEPETIPLDVVLGYVADGAGDDVSIEVATAPPTILHATTPTLLVVLDGEPIKVQVEGADGLSLVVNTNWDLFYSEEASAYALLLGDAWLGAATLDGPWLATVAPAGVSALPGDDRWQAVKAAVPGETLASEDTPDIRVVQAPAELIVTDGAPELEPIPGTDLSFVANTSSDIVFNTGDAHYYFLTSGRWFKATSLDGVWSFVPTTPASFQQIPADHARSGVRASIAGTPEAAKAVAEAQIPQTAEVSRQTAAPTITYAGDAPDFEKIEGVDVYRATNTTFDVFRIDALYYLCHDGVWFVSDTPNGPWFVTEAVPTAMYDIPASSPAHHVTYVRVYQTTPNTVYFGYTPGYHYTYVSNGVVVYGSGYYWGTYYTPYAYAYAPYWYYSPYPYTYGQASIYNTGTGRYVHGHYAYGPYGGYWEGNRYNPNTGRYGGGVYAYDYDTAVYEGWSYNPRNDVSTNTSQAIQWSDGNNYETWGDTVVQRDDNWVRAERYGTEDGFRREVQTSEGGRAVQVGNTDGRATAGQTGDGDLYAGANGNVFRRTDDGSWETRSEGEWTSVDTASGADTVRTEASARGMEPITLDQPERLTSSQNSQSWDFDRQRLERDRSARTGGRSQYESFRSSRSGGRSFQGRQR